MGPANLVSVSSYPLPTNLAGTSVRITISGRNVDAILYYSARFDCVARVSDGSLTIPPAVLLALPPTGDTMGTVTVGNTYNRVPFTATGLDHGFIYFGTNNLNLGIVTCR